MRELLLIPLEDVVVFPNMSVTLSVDVGEESEVLLVPRHEGSYADVGTVASVGDRVRLPGGASAVTLEGLHRGLIGAARSDANGQLRAEVEERPDEPVPPLHGLDLRVVERTPDLTRDGAREEAAAHADPPMDAPAVDRHPHFGQGPLPRKDVRVDGVDQRAVEVEDQGRHDSETIIRRR